MAIERSLAIVTPNGQRTVLGLYGNGYLESVAGRAGLQRTMRSPGPEVIGTASALQ